MSEVPIFVCKICGGDKFDGVEQFNQHSSKLKHLNKLPLYITVKASCNHDQIKSIHEYFEKFGTIFKHEERIEGDYTFIDYYFQDPKVYTNIVHKDHELFDAKLEISWNKNRRLVAVNYVSYEDCISIVNGLKEGKTFCQQVEILLSSVQTTNEAEIEEKLKIIYNDLTELLNPTFPTHQIHFIGSRATGLDLKWSCLDIYLTNVRESNESETLAYATLKELITESEKFCPAYLYREKFSSFILKCLHTRTQISCRLNMRDRLSVAQSKLIKYYLALDKKIRPLTIIIKFWVECHNFTRYGLCSGYALFLMVIFFLQQEPYNLPSVYDLQKDCSADVDVGWNCAFGTPENEFPALYDESLLNLVVGFFRFYSHFDYVTQVVCPYLGTAVKKTAFVRPYDLPDSYQHYCTGRHEISKLSTALCVQDPFEHNRNVSMTLTLQNSGRFAIMCKICEQHAAQTAEIEFLSRILIKCEYSMMKEISFIVEKEDDFKNEQQWFALLKGFTRKVLKEIIYCQINQVTDLDSAQVLDCVCRHNVWNQRVEIWKALQQRLPPETNDFDLELAVVPHILENCPQVLDPKGVYPQFSLVLTMKENPCRVEFVMKLENQSFYCHLSHYFWLNFSNWLKIAESRNNMEESSKANEIIEQSWTSGLGLTPIESDEDDEMFKSDGELTSENTACSDKQVAKLYGNPQPQFVENQAIKDSADDSKTNEMLTEEKPKPIEEGEIVDEESEEEDIPADFFDDFANEDFMDGLDIVDAWDEEEKSLVEDDNSKGSKKEIHSPIDLFLEESHPKTPERREKRARDRHKSKSETPLKRRKCCHSRKSRVKSREKHKCRDLEKNKASINKDKVKRAKDKLKIVETDLASPRTEMDVEDVPVVKNKEIFIEELQKTVRNLLNDKLGFTRTESSCHRKRSWSIDSDLSDNEVLRSKRKRSRLGSEESPSNFKSKNSDDKSKKNTFLEEIRDRLKEMRLFVQPNNLNCRIPDLQPVPAPTFYIGNAYPVSLKQAQSFNSLLSNTSSKVVALPQVKPNPVQPKLAIHKESSAQLVVQKAAEDVEKLFADEKISLSDFLTIRAKGAVQSTSLEHIQRKVKVISRCQHAIKAMSADRFRWLQSMKSSSEALMKHQSPLRRLTRVRLQFTSPPKVPEVDSYATALDEILRKIGILNEAIDLDEVPEDSIKSRTCSSLESAPTSKTSQLQFKTDVSSCRECRERKLKVYADASVQVNEEELDPAKDLLGKENQQAYGCGYHPYLQLYGAPSMGERLEYVQGGSALGEWDSRGSFWDWQYENVSSHSPYIDFCQTYWGSYPYGFGPSGNCTLPYPIGSPAIESVSSKIEEKKSFLPSDTHSTPVQSKGRNNLPQQTLSAWKNSVFSKAVTTNDVTTGEIVPTNDILTSEDVPTSEVISASDVIPTSEVVPNNSVTTTEVVSTKGVTTSEIVINREVVTPTDVAHTAIVTNATNPVFTLEEMRALRPANWPKNKRFRKRIRLPDGRRYRICVPPDRPQSSMLDQNKTSSIPPTLPSPPVNFIDGNNLSQVEESNMASEEVSSVNDIASNDVAFNDDVVPNDVTSNDDVAPNDVFPDDDIAPNRIVINEAVTSQITETERQITPITSSNIANSTPNPRICFTLEELKAFRPPDWPTNKRWRQCITFPDGYRQWINVPPDIEPSDVPPSEVVGSNVAPCENTTMETIAREVVNDVTPTEIVASNLIPNEVVTKDVAVRDEVASENVISDTVNNKVVTNDVAFGEAVVSKLGTSKDNISELVTSGVVGSDVDTITNDVNFSDTVITSYETVSDAAPSEITPSGIFIREISTNEIASSDAVPRNNDFDEIATSDITSCESVNEAVTTEVVTSDVAPGYIVTSDSVTSKVAAGDVTSSEAITAVPVPVLKANNF